MIVVILASWCGVCLLSFWSGVRLFVIILVRCSFVFVMVNFYLCEGNLDEQNISDQRQEIKSIVVNMLHN